METLEFNDYSKFILQNFEKEMNFHEEELIKKIKNDLTNFKKSIYQTSFKILDNIVKAESLNKKINSNLHTQNIEDSESVKNFQKINVGGVIFSTKLSTLLKYPNSKFAQIINLQKRFKLSSEYIDDEGFIFFDRNPKYFVFVLDAIRNESFIETNDECLNNYILEELKYYNIDFLFSRKRKSIESPAIVNINPKSPNNFEIKNDIYRNNDQLNKPLKKKVNKKNLDNAFKIENNENDFIFNGKNSPLENGKKENINFENQKALDINFQTFPQNYNIDIANNKIIIDKKFEFDKNSKNKNLKLSNEDQTVENIVGWEDACVLGNLEMFSGKYEWEIHIDCLSYDNWITIGVVEKEHISRDMKDEHLNSWSISSTKESWRMDKPLNNLKQNNIYFCSLDFENDLFRIIGPGIDCKNSESIIGKKLFLLVNVFNLKNKLTIRNFKSFIENINN